MGRKLKLRPSTKLETIAPGVLRWTDRDGFVVIIYELDVIEALKDDDQYRRN